MYNKPDSCAGCSLYETGHGFVLGTGNSATAKYMIVLETPEKADTQKVLTKDEYAEEIAVRQKAYPGLANGSIRTGVPLAGPAGLVLKYWLLKKVGIREEDCFIDHVLRCLPPKGKTGTAYPTGEIKKTAELHCRQYDRFGAFRPDTMVFGINPSGLLREITPLPLVLKDFEKTRDFTQQGRRVLFLLGGKATSAFARYGSNVTKWRGHYQALAADWVDMYRSLFEFTAKKKRTKKVVDVPIPE